MGGVIDSGRGRAGWTGWCYIGGLHVDVCGHAEECVDEVDNAVHRHEVKVGKAVLRRPRNGWVGQRLAAAKWMCEG
jgi:hypothetical protein